MPTDARNGIAGAADRRTTIAQLGSLSGSQALGTRGFLSILAFWFWLPVLVGALGFLFADDVGLRAFLIFASIALLFAILWSLVTAAIFWLTTRYTLEHGNRLMRNVVLIGAAITAALVAALIGAAVLSALGFVPMDETGSPVSMMEMMPRMIFPNLMIGGAIVVTGLARDASFRGRIRREQAVQLEAHNAQLQAQLAEARLRVLHTQLNPHFLFNTLNAVSSLMDEDSRSARRMIARLSELLRYSLQDSIAAEIPVRDELKLVGRYLEIVEIRYQGRLETKISAEPEAEDALVPSLILQPLAENAMKHGVGKAGGRGRIEVNVARSGDRVILRVTDTGPGAMRDEPPEGGGAGLGLRHTRERLQELYGEDQRFTLEPLRDGGMLAEIVVPYHTAPAPGAVPVHSSV